jgi:hypothetical protein
VISLISSCITFHSGLLCDKVFAAHLFTSTKPSSLKPAFSNPNANPPAPANNSTTVYDLLIMIYPFYFI